MRRLVTCAALAGVMTGTARAQSPDLVTDRPDQTESAAVVPPGWIQFEGGLDFGMQRSQVAGVEHKLDAFNLPAALLRIGVLPSVELRLGAGYTHQESSLDSRDQHTLSGLSNVSVGAKVRLGHEQGLRPETALLAQFTLPVGRADLRSERVVSEVRLAAAHTLSERVGVAYNVGGSWESSEAWAVLYTVALGAELTPGVGGFVEVFGERARGVPVSVSLDGGFTVTLVPNVQLDVAAGVGLRGPVDDVFVGTGFSVRLPR
ncbi:MAG: transporter [Rhodothermales bacterium]